MTLEATTDPVSQVLVAALIVCVFALLAVDKAHRVLIMAGAVALLWLITYLTPYRLIPFEAGQRAVDLNVILLLASMMAIVGVLKTTGVFSWTVGRVLYRSRGRTALIVTLIAWFTGLMSSVADNVTTVIVAVPIAFEVAALMRIPTAALLLPMVVASNIGGTATLIGDPPNILIGSGAHLSFPAFVLNLGPPVLLMLVVIEWFSQRYFRPAIRAARPLEPSAVGSRPIEQPILLRWGLVISALVFLGFLTHVATGMPASVRALIGAAALLIVQDLLALRTQAPSIGERVHGILTVIEREIEWPTLCFFALLFIAVGAAAETGLIDALASGLAGFIQNSRAYFGLTEAGTLLLAALLILWVSGFLSAVIDSIPYVAVSIPIVAKLAPQLGGETEILWWALSLGACLGGNGTAIGASANVTVIGLAERAGS